MNIDKQKFHLAASQGWINDPNGLIYHNGVYHVFYQHYPYATHWGPMHWGHQVSSDLVKWEELPIALKPDKDYDIDGCFSGSALFDNGKMYLMYTGHTFNKDTNTVREVQCIAASDDCIHFEKYASNPVIGTDMIPEGFSLSDFRDPKLFKRDGKYYCVIGSRRTDGKGDILLYTSCNLYSWEFVGSLLNEGLEIGQMIECPDYSEINGQGLLIVSPQDAKRDGIKHCNIHTNAYLANNIDFKSGCLVGLKKPEIIDYGFDFYAGQTMNDGKDTIMIGWSQMWDRDIPSKASGRAGQMTLPRKLSLKNGLYQQPVDISKYCTTLAKHSFKGDYEMRGNGIALLIEIEYAALRDLNIKLRQNKEHYVEISFDSVNKQLVFDRSNMGVTVTGRETDEFSLAGIRRMPVKTNGVMQIYTDIYSVEIFADGLSMTNNIYTSDADRFSISGNADSTEISVKEINID